MRLKYVLMGLAGLVICSAAASAQCRDPWVSQAVQQVMNRPAQGSADSGECYVGNYGGGRWSSYPDLVGKVQSHFQGVCRDTWVTQAVRQVTGRAPNGYGDSGECAPAMYTGSWSSYPDLVNKVTARLRPPTIQPTGGPALRPGYVPPSSLIQPGTGAGVIAAGAGNVIAQGAGNVIAQGAGNVIAQGAGNVIAQGAGNFRFRGEDDLKLARKGDAEAQYHAGLAYAQGQGVEQDLVEAYKWLSLAADQGVKEAAEERKEVRAKLSPEDLKKATKAFQEFKPEGGAENK